jgi:hypothetical protein
MVVKIVYHKVTDCTDCPDGIAAAAVAAMAFNFDCEVYGDVYRHAQDYTMPPNPPFDVERGDRLIVVDFSYPASWLNCWEEAGVELTVIDHHAPKFPMLEGFIGAILDAEECGATLAWRTFFPDRELPDILKAVRQRDIGRDGYYQHPCPVPGSHEVNEGLSHWRHQNLSGLEPIEKCRQLAELIDKDMTLEFQAIGAPIVEERDRVVAHAVRNKSCVTRLDGISCIRVEIAEDEIRFASIIGNVAAYEYQNCGVQFAWLVMPDGSNSLRSCLVLPDFVSLS